MLEEQLRDAARELRAVTDSHVREAPSRDGLAEVRHRRAVRRRRRHAVVGVAAALVVLAASAAVFASTRSNGGRVVTAEPGSTDDRAAIESTIKTVWEEVRPLDEQLALIEDSDGLAGVIEAARSDPRAALTLRIDIGSIYFSGDSAIADVSYYLSGRLAATAPEISLVKRDGRWLVTRASFCEVVRAAVQCPAPGETYTPTTSTTEPPVAAPAVWPTADRDEPWRLDPRATAERFANEVLGWQGVTSASDPDHNGIIDVTEGQRTVAVGVTNADGKGWSVYYALSRGAWDDEFGASVGIDETRAQFGVGPLAPDSASVTITYTRGSTAETKPGPGATFAPGDLTQPGSVIVLARDASGHVVGVWATGFAPGPFSAS